MQKVNNYNYIYPFARVFIDSYPESYKHLDNGAVVYADKKLAIVYEGVTKSEQGTVEGVNLFTTNKVAFRTDIMVYTLKRRYAKKYGGKTPQKINKIFDDWLHEKTKQRDGKK